MCHFAAFIAFLFVTRRVNNYVESKVMHRNHFDEMPEGEYEIFRVVGNGFIPFIYSTLYLLDCGSGDRPIEFQENTQANKYQIAILGENA